MKSSGDWLGGDVPAIANRYVLAATASFGKESSRIVTRTLSPCRANSLRNSFRRQSRPALLALRRHAARESSAVR